VRVIIAEDDAVSRTILRLSLEKLGHECLAAENGHEALKLYRNTPEVDLVISDWMMPGIDGPGLRRLIREDGRDGYTYFHSRTCVEL
jgi:CheY-like chemotaxis protein